MFLAWERIVQNNNFLSCKKERRDVRDNTFPFPPCLSIMYVELTQITVYFPVSF